MYRLFMSKEIRDREWKKLTPRPRRSSIRAQQIHPQYIEDYTEVTGRVLTAADCGFGNTIYKTFFPVLYKLES
jgi:hypothetical protein